MALLLGLGPGDRDVNTVPFKPLEFGRLGEVQEERAARPGGASAPREAELGEQAQAGPVPASGHDSGTAQLSRHLLRLAGLVGMFSGEPGWGDRGDSRGSREAGT